MVLTRRVGKKRPFWRGFVLSLATFGLYSVYWAYKAHSEVFKQYELDREGRDDGIVWLVLGLIVNFLVFVYYWKFVANVNHVRERMRLGSAITPATFIGLQIGAGVVFFVVAIAGLIAAVALTGADAATSEDAADEAGIAIILGAYGLGVLIAAPMVLYAYYRLQIGINETWDWYDAHINQLAAGPPPPSPPATPQGEQAPPEHDPTSG